jgi:hypothetical protein
VQFVGLVMWTLGLAVLWAEGVQRPLIDRVRGAQTTQPEAQTGFRLMFARRPRVVGRTTAAASSAKLAPDTEALADRPGTL